VNVDGFTIIAYGDTRDDRDGPGLVNNPELPYKSSLPLYYGQKLGLPLTELLPDFRATMLAGFYALAGVGRAFGALVGGPVWTAGGIQATGLLSGTLTLVAVLCLAAGLKGWQPGAMDR